MVERCLSFFFSMIFDYILIWIFFWMIRIVKGGETWWTCMNSTGARRQYIYENYRITKKKLIKKNLLLLYVSF
ncbi:hypothetical protein HanRHA438_Chr11g0525461 [Helianthus annuus]|nr:hypothetical protein HanRHA438_Chr11g0525461 [Helianthus annuus]